MTRWSGNQSLEVLTLALDGEIFAIGADMVHEILDVIAITEVPNARPFVNGLINVRGRVVPLVDLRFKFGMARKPPTIDTRIIVLEVDLDGEPTIIGALADKVFEVTEVAAGALEDTPRIGMRWRADFIRCIGKRAEDFIIILDINRIIASDERAYLGPDLRAAAE